MAEVNAQPEKQLAVDIIKKKSKTLPNSAVNIPFFVKNNSSQNIILEFEMDLPEKWNLITSLNGLELKPNERKFQLLSLRVPSGCAVKEYRIGIDVLEQSLGKSIARGEAFVSVEEVEEISLQLIESAEYIMAGETYKAIFLLENNGNTPKKVYLETFNCDVQGEAVVAVNPGESRKVIVVKPTSKEEINTRTEHLSLRAIVSGEVKDRIFRPIMIFPVKNLKKDLFHRFPVDASITYMGMNADSTYQSGYQFELSGSGKLDPEGKHYLEFLARTPDNSDYSYFGSYDQYYISYSNKNLELSVGEKSYEFTSLTEPSRYGTGFENKVLLNNGLHAGFVYVKPRFYDDISRVMAFYTGYEKGSKTKMNLFFIQKEETDVEDLTYLMSLSSSFQIFPKTSIGFEVSRGILGDIAGNAFKGNISSRFSIFSIQGVYYNVGENYPGYYSSSVFYSGSFSAQLSSKMKVGVFANQDFSNAELDTFFVTAPFSRSIQYSWGYAFTPNSNLRLYWNDREQSDRMSDQKFDYKTRSMNAQFQQRINRFSGTLSGSYGKTTNYLLSEVSNQQNTYLLSSALSHKFSNRLGLRVFGSYSNLNSYISGTNRSVTAGMSINSTVREKLKASLSVQNAYNIEDYYKNRNLLQLNLDYSISKNHQLGFRCYYTLFKDELEKPELYLSASYKYKFGIPLKQVIKAGDLVGRLVDSNDQPRSGVLVSFLNKSVITDKNGEFGFSTIAPGLYTLTIDRSKFEIDEIPNIPEPIMVEIIEDNETVLNIQMTKGAKLTGKFVLNSSDGKPVTGDEIGLGNIVLELKNDFKHYRVVTSSKGEFSFPLVLPSSWSMVVYKNTLPEGYVLEQKEYNFNFTSGERVELEVGIKKKERKIIFKSEGFSLSSSIKTGLQPLKPKENVDTAKKVQKEEAIYTVQVGAFSRKLSKDSRFFKGRVFDFEKQIDNLYKYYMGRFKKLSDAQIFKKELQSEFRSAFVVGIKNGQVVAVDEL